MLPKLEFDLNMFKFPEFQKMSRILAPTFKFGGKEGSLVTALVFKAL